jgi:hypothetical protein
VVVEVLEDVVEVLVDVVEVTELVVDVKESVVVLVIVVVTVQKSHVRSHPPASGQLGQKSTSHRFCDGGVQVGQTALVVAQNASVKRFVFQHVVVVVSVVEVADVVVEVVLVLSVVVDSVEVVVVVREQKLQVVSQ